MKYLLLGFVIGLIGCCDAPKDITPEIDSLKRMLREGSKEQTAAIDAAAIDISENTAALQVISDRVESLKKVIVESTTKPEPPPTTPAAEVAANPATPAVQPLEPAAGVVLLVNTTFGCAPCERMKADHAAGKLKGFDVKFLPTGESFEGQKVNPAIRYKTTTSKTGWAVRYGYDSNQLQWLKDNLLPKTTEKTTEGQPVAGSFFPYHGTGQNFGSSGVFRSVSRWSPDGWRARNSLRASCPSGNCPR
jgi:hypothetical protein